MLADLPLIPARPSKDRPKIKGPLDTHERMLYLFAEMLAEYEELNTIRADKTPDQHDGLKSISLEDDRNPSSSKRKFDDELEEKMDKIWRKRARTDAHGWVVPLPDFAEKKAAIPEQNAAVRKTKVTKSRKTGKGRRAGKRK